MLAGVSGGLARYFEIHPAVFRVGFVVLTLLGGAGILIYAAAALVMPDEGKEDSIATAALRDRRDRPWPLIGLGLLAVAGAVLLSHATLWPSGDSWLLLPDRGRPDPLDHAGSPAADPAKDATELAAEDSRRVTARLCAERRSCSRRWSPSCSSPPPSSRPSSTCTSGVASATARTRSRACRSLRSDYRLGIGSIELDLGALQLPKGETHVDASVDVGDLLIIVPKDVALQVHADGRGRVGRAARARPTTAATSTST